MSTKPRRFFLVDDNEIDLTVNEKLLTLSGLTNDVLTFLDAPSFLSAIQQDPHIQSYENILLLDIMMPGMNGFECAESFAALPSTITAEFRVYVLSSTIDRNDIRRASEIPIVKRVLEKPLDVFLLVDLLS
jgi:CheY-like chemotaxis protein